MIGKVFETKAYKKREEDAGPSKPDWGNNIDLFFKVDFGLKVYKNFYIGLGDYE
ncbi:hypothetical protein KAU11_04635 [Candidatus Babeliales bacterium]|nr:hypothetical protein [Candidatus Babeliales bacterium]